MKKSYEELIGSLGRGMFFRPERQRVRDLLSRDARPDLVVAGRTHRLFDASMNGLSFLAAEATEGFPVGEEVDIVLGLHGKEVYRGRARVARREADARGMRIGLALSTGFLDLPEVQRQDEEARLERELRLGPEALRGRVPRGYRDVVAEAVYFVQFYRQALDRQEARYRSDGSNGVEELSRLAARALPAIRERWLELSHRASLAAAECLDDARALQAAKELTESALTPLLLDAPMVHRSYTKPLGYPGDYRVMLYYYANVLEGPSAFAQVFHKLFVEHPLSNGVRTRCGFVVDLMREQHERKLASSASPSYRVASLGCGPARESAIYAETRLSWPGQVSWTLIDQEEQTLSIAYRDTQVGLARSGANGQVRCLNVSFAQLLGEGSIMPFVEAQDFIFSTGLFDYLREARARQIVRTLYDQLAPDGLLAIGNAIGPNEHFWAPEFILDWTLLYRTREEMERLALDLPPSAQATVVVEPGNAYYFLLVRKRA
jgi:extracellular factor (EF) 3-hydroxypalmitic acid methyl ester biosynthesis protein